MNFLKRSFLNVKARKGKSLLQIFIFSVICILVLSGLSIQSAAEKASDLARQKLGGDVTLQVDMEKMREKMQSSGSQLRFGREPIPVKSAEELLSYSQLKGYNFYSSTLGKANSFNPIENETSGTEENTNQSNTGQPDGGRMPGGIANADVSIQGVSFTDSVQEFLDGNSSITDGNHITDNDLNSNVALVEKTLAEENNLKIGDTINVSSARDESTSAELKIVGIYETSSSGDDQAMNFTAMNPYNKIYVPYTVANTLKGTDYKDTIDNAVYYMKDPAKMDSFVSEAKKNSSIDFNTFKLDANDQLYQQMMGPIQNVASFSKNVVYLVTIAGAIILGLIVMMSIRERKYEMGVLLAIGEKRWKLIGQFITEILMVAVIALGIATVSGKVVADKIGDQLLSQELTAQTNESASSPASFGGPGMGFGRGMQGMLGMRVQQQVDPVDDLQIEVTSHDLGMLSLIGFLIAVLSALLPSLSVLRLQPKTILTKQD
ncbi:ABC transporter permease [Bacillus sp. 03113]|uniref:ABC transporter permease n=1 Tax=Bacillus sp. 03113 TaxID=2578211 RepID=UPI00114480DD|nr:ABC transporter permease [Bacillus sp. 03113]